MTVKELIKELQKYDDEDEVVMQNDENGWYNIDYIRKEKSINGHNVINLGRVE